MFRTLNTFTVSGVWERDTHWQITSPALFNPRARYASSHALRGNKKN
jgi:outer membrane protein assembly factor BamB